jgi:hypothetical protein
MRDSKALQDLTNEFLKKFFELTHAEAVETKAKSKHPQLENDKRNDSFAFNYDLPAYLLQSEHYQQKQKNFDYPLIGSGFVGNVCKESFKQNIQGVSMDLKFIITHFKKQDKDLDYFAKNYTKTSEKKIVKVINVESFHDKTQPFEIDGEVEFTTETMLIHNNKNSYIGKCVLQSEDGELQKILVYGERDGDGDINRDLQLTINYHQIDGIETPEIQHYKHIANINSFFLMINQIIFGINDVLEEETKKKQKS